MEFPSWFQTAIQRRLDHVSARIECHSELCKRREEEHATFHAMLSGVEQAQLPAFMEWEEKQHFTRALENEHLYLQGMRDGVQLAFALLSDPIPSGGEAMANLKKTDSRTNEPEAGGKL
ncbi:MAG: hypothetical protein KZY74_19990 [Paenibacillaceae bacterium]|nr:hypothetical protein [Paenibacillaceae bacterium]